MKINKYFWWISVLFGSNMCVISNMYSGTNKTNYISRTDFASMPGTAYLDAIASVGNKKLQHVYSEDGSLNFTEIAKKYINKSAEEFDVTTEDGYILKLFHIPGNEKNIVLIGHSMLASSDDLFIRGNISLIYMLAEQGFDVWAINFRGSRYSRNHVTLNPDTGKEFWQYSMHEIGLYDYKATIDFILDKTGQEKLSVVGHSEGGSAFFVLMTERPEYNNKIKIFIGLAAVCYLRHAGPTASALLPLANEINAIFQILNIEEFFGYNSLAKRILDIICSKGLIGYKFCFNLLGLLTGFNEENIEQEFSSTILGHGPAGTSRKSLIHYAHIYRFNQFCQFDYGVDNFKVYGSRNPPNYDLMKVTAKIALFAAKGDLLADIEDTERLRDNLPNVVHYQVVSDDKFNHVDYLWAKNAHIVLYPYVIDILTKHNRIE